MEQKYKKCRGCGGNLYFSPEYNNLKFSSCDSVTSFDIEPPPDKPSPDFI